MSRLYAIYNEMNHAVIFLFLMDEWKFCGCLVTVDASRQVEGVGRWKASRESVHSRYSVRCSRSSMLLVFWFSRVRFTEPCRLEVKL